MRIKPRNRLQRDKPEPLAVPETPNEVWSMDFMADQIVDDWSFRTLNVLDGFNREELAIEVGFSLPSERVVRALNQLIGWRRKPLAIRVDVHSARQAQQNAYVEHHNRTVMTEWLGRYHFESIAEVQNHAIRWLWTHNNELPNNGIGIGIGIGIGGMTPIQKLKAA